MRKPFVIAIGATIAIIAVVFGYQASVVTPKEPARQETMVPQPQVSKIRVIASFYPLYEFTTNIAKGKADVSVLTPVGVEPHDWEPSTQDLVALNESDVFVYNGMEPYVGKIIDQYPSVLFVESSQGIEMNGTDPHIWLDPVLAKAQVMMIKDSLIKVDPNNAQFYEDNTNAYSKQLDELDYTIKTELSSCKKDTIVPFHDAFSYFGSRYGIKIHALSGIIPESEPTAADLKNLIDFVKQNQIKIIFAEELVDPKLAQTLADEVGVQIMTLSPLEGLSKDDMSSGKSYLDKMNDNLKNIKIALECT